MYFNLFSFRCHSYTYGSNYIDKSTYLKWLEEVEYFVKNFIQIKPEDIDAENLEEFLDNSEGFKVNKEEGSKFIIGNMTYEYDKKCF